MDKKLSNMPALANPVVTVTQPEYIYTYFGISERRFDQLQVKMNEIRDATLNKLNSGAQCTAITDVIEPLIALAKSAKEKQYLFFTAGVINRIIDEAVEQRNRSPLFSLLRAFSGI